MAAGDLTLNMIISATNMTGDAFNAIAGQLGKLAGSGGLGMVAAGAIAAGAAVMDIGVTAAKAAGDFQQSMTTLVTSAGESRANIKMVSDGILQLSTDTATSTDQLVKGMYFIESSGMHGADGLLVLKAAAQGAKTENADLTTVAKALSTVMSDYHMPASQAAEAMNGLIAAVQHGKTTLQDLSSAMGAVLPIASSLHIPFAQVAGAMDTMTNAGMSSQQAAQNLAHVLVSLSAPSGVAVKSMVAVGLSAQQVKDALVNQGLPEALQLIEDHVGKKFPEGSVAYEQALKNILGGIVGVKLAAMLTGDSLKETQDNIAAVTAAMKENGNEVMGWADIQQNFNFQLDRAKMAVQALFVALGEKLLPILTPIIKGFADAVQAFTGFISGLSTVSKVVTETGNVVDAFHGKFVAGMRFDEVGSELKTLAMSFTTFGMTIQQDFNAMAQVVGQVAGAIAQSFEGAIAPAIKIVTQIVDGLQQTFDVIMMSIQGSVLPAFQSLGQAVGTATADFLSFIANSGGVNSFFSMLMDTISKVISIFGTLVANLSGLVKPAFDLLKKALADIGAVLSPVWQAINSQLLPSLQSFAQYLGPLLTSLGTLVSKISTNKEAMNALGQVLTWLVTLLSKFVDGLTVIVWAVTKVIDAFNNLNQLPPFVQAVIKGIITPFWMASDTLVGNSIVPDMIAKILEVFGKLTDLKGLVESALKAVVQVFAGLWQSVEPALQSLLSGLTNWFESLPAQFAKFGENLMKSVAEGIKNGAGAIGQAIHDAMSSAVSALGFQSVPGFAGGVSNFTGGWAVVGERGPELLFLPRGASVIPSGSPPSVASAAPTAGTSTATGTASQQPMVIYMMLDSKQIGKAVTVYQQGELRVQGGIRST